MSGDSSRLPAIPNSDRDHSAGIPDKWALLDDAFWFHFDWVADRLAHDHDDLRKRLESGELEREVADRFVYGAREPAVGPLGRDAATFDDRLDRLKSCMGRFARVLPHSRIPLNLSAEWKDAFSTLSLPAYTVAALYSLPDVPEFPREGLAKWHRALRHATEASHEVLSRLDPTAGRTVRAGQAILDAIAPIKAALNRTATFLIDGQPAWTDPQRQVAAARAELAGSTTHDLAPLLEELSEAVSFDSKRGAQVGKPPEKTIWHHGERSYSRDGINSYVVKEDEDNILQAFSKIKRAMDTSELGDKSGVTNVARTIGQLRDGYGGVFADAIRTPEGKKAAGGYLILVRPIPPS
jgi:hypothetical protein